MSINACLIRVGHIRMPSLKKEGFPATSSSPGWRSVPGGRVRTYLSNSLITEWASRKLSGARFINLFSQPNLHGEGTGLGLSNPHKIIKMYGEELSLMASGEQDTIFCVKRQ